MPLDLLSGWDQLSEADRVTILAALLEIVDTRLREEAWYPNTPGATPSVEVYGARQDELRLTVQFLGHYLMYCFAQSGSDWAYHYVFTGEAVFVGTRCVANTVALVVEKFLSERDVDSYDRAATVAEVRDAAIATSSAAPLPAPILVAEEPAPPGPSSYVPGLPPTREPPPIPIDSCASPRVQTVVRCPECGSTDAGAIDHMIEITHMMCRGCGHDAYVDSYQLGDDWNVDFEIPAGAAFLPSYVTPLGRS